MKIEIDTNNIKANILAIFNRKPKLRDEIARLEKQIEEMKKTRENREDQEAQKSAS